MTAVLVTYQQDRRVDERLVTIDDAHDFAQGPYQDTVGFAVGSNQSIVPLEYASRRFLLQLVEDFVCA